MRPLIRIVAFIAALATLAQAPAALAQGRTLIRDAEIERTLDMLAAPIFDASGLGRGHVRMLIALDPQLNAFVAGGRTMVLYTGLLRRFENPGAIIGVIAHEAGHLTGGHLARRRIVAEGLSGASLLGSIVGAAAGVAAGSGGAAAALAIGGQEAGRRAFLQYSRAEEAAADQAGIAYMNRAGIDPGGVLDVLELFRGQEVFQSDRLDPYVLSHPLSQERISLLERRVEASPARGAPIDPELAYWHARMRAKLDAFVDRPERVLSRLDAASDRDEETGLYRRAIALHRLARADEALAVLDRLLAKRPDDPFYTELKGQILFESGRPAEALAPYRRAVALAPGEPLIRANLGRALLAAGRDAEALDTLERATRDDPGDASALRDLAVAYARAGRDGEASLATAERFAIMGDFDSAGIHARRAVDMLPRGSPDWLRADDIASLDRDR